MRSIKAIVLSASVSEDKRIEFIRVCSDWALFCESISRFDKVEILRIIHYLIEDRPKSKRLLERAIGRFNRLNALKKEDLT